MVKTKSISIHAVQVPNPNAMKFEIPGLSLASQMYEFANAEEAVVSPLALKLFSFDYVERVFFYRNFITVHRVEDGNPPWESVLMDLRIIIKRHLEMGEPIFEEIAESLTDPATDNELEARIKMIIDAEIRPATWQDGGDITFESINDGVVSVRLAGACIRCPFGPRTVKQGVEVVLKRAFPYEVKEVTSTYVDWNDTQIEATPGFDKRGESN